MVTKPKTLNTTKITIIKRKGETKKMIDDFDMTNVEDEKVLEEIRGENIRKPKLSALNQKKLSKWEMDELFMDGEEYEEEF